MGKVIQMPPKDDNPKNWTGEDWKRMFEGIRDKVSDDFLKRQGMTREEHAWQFLAEFVAALLEQAEKQ